MSADQHVGLLMVAGSIITLAAAVIYAVWKFDRNLECAWSDAMLTADERIEEALLAGPLDESAETFDASVLPLSDSPAAQRIRKMLDEQAALTELRADLERWGA